MDKVYIWLSRAVYLDVERNVMFFMPRYDEKDRLQKGMCKRTEMRNL